MNPLYTSPSAPPSPPPPTPTLSLPLSFRPPVRTHSRRASLLPPSPFPHPSPPSEQPHVREEHPNRDEKPEPDLPADARLPRHPEHAVHGAAEARARAVEGVVHGVGEGGGGADLVADGEGDLFVKKGGGEVSGGYGFCEGFIGEGGGGEEREREGREGGKKGRATNILQHLHLGAYPLEVLVVLVLELREHGVAVLTPAFSKASISLMHHRHLPSNISPLESKPPLPFPQSPYPLGKPSHSLPRSLPHRAPRNPLSPTPHFPFIYTVLYIPRIWRRAPKPAVDQPHPARAGPRVPAARPRVAISAAWGRARAAAIAGVGVEEGGAGVALVEGGRAEAAGDGHCEWVGEWVGGA